MGSLASSLEGGGCGKGRVGAGKESKQLGRWGAFCLEGNYPPQTPMGATRGAAPDP